METYSLTAQLDVWSQDFQECHAPFQSPQGRILPCLLSFLCGPVCSLAYDSINSSGAFSHLLMTIFLCASTYVSSVRAPVTLDRVHLNNLNLTTSAKTSFQTRSQSQIRTCIFGEGSDILQIPNTPVPGYSGCPTSLIFSSPLLTSCGKEKIKVPMGLSLMYSEIFCIHNRTHSNPYVVLFMKACNFKSICLCGTLPSQSTVCNF